MSSVALMRHYPTEWNVARRLQGRTDVPLTDQARETLSGLAMPPPWDAARLIASPLIRAMETARILAGERTVEIDQRLVELSWGAWEGKCVDDLLEDAASGFRPTHLWGPDDRAPDGESPAEAWERIRPALTAIAAGPSAVLVIHKALMRLILQRAGLAEPEIKRGRLYSLTLAADGLPSAPGEPVRLVPG